MDYLLLKHVHMTCAALSGGLFTLRGGWMLANSALLQRRWVKVLPHIIDTLLLVSAIGLAIWSQQNPIRTPWLGTKIVALLVYIVLGSIALKYGRTRGIRVAAFIAALVTFAYIVTVAITKNPLFFV